MSPAEAPGVVTADPTLFIAICWVLSAVILGGLTLHAILSTRKVK